MACTINVILLKDYLILTVIAALSRCAKDTGGEQVTPGIQAADQWSHCWDLCPEEWHGLLWGQPTVWLQCDRVLCRAVSHGPQAEWHGAHMGSQQRWILHWSFNSLDATILYACFTPHRQDFFWIRKNHDPSSLSKGVKLFFALELRSSDGRRKVAYFFWCIHWNNYPFNKMQTIKKSVYKTKT